MLDPEELNFIIDDAISKGVFFRQSIARLSSGEQFGTIVEYFQDEMPQYTHLRSYMLAYVTINLLTMVNRFPNIAVRVATDSFYYDKKYHPEVEKYLGDGVTWGTWRVKDEELHTYKVSADVSNPREYHETVIYSAEENRLFCELFEIESINDADRIKSLYSTAPSIEDPISRHKLVYLNGPGGYGKTTRIINQFHNQMDDFLVLTPTHRLARYFTEKGIEANTYHSFFLYSGGEWDSSRMGNKFVPRVIMWDEVCIVSERLLKLFLDWLRTKETIVILCGDHGQPPPFTSGEASPHNWLKGYVDYYEEMTVDRRSLDNDLAKLKSNIRCTDNSNQGYHFRETIPGTTLEDFVHQWKPTDMVVSSRKIIRDGISSQLFKIHQKKFPNELVPLCYRPKNTRLQNILVDIPGSKKNGIQQQQQLVLNDIVFVNIHAVEDALNMDNSPWILGYAATIHSSQGLTITDTIVWIIDNYIEWDNLIYLAVSRVRRITQLRRVILPRSKTPAVIEYHQE